MADATPRLNWTARRIQDRYEALLQADVRSSRPGRAWDALFADITPLIADDHAVPSGGSALLWPTLSDFAIRRVAEGLVGEAESRGRRTAASRKWMGTRLKPVFEAIEARELLLPRAVARVCSDAVLLRYYTHRQFILDWLAALRTRGFPEDAVLPGEVLFWRWGTTWPEAGEVLQGLLDHQSPWVRAVAAQGLGECFASTDAALAPQAGELFRTIAEKERATPGVAGPFLAEVLDLDEVVGGPGVQPLIDLKRWAFDIISNANQPEPDLYMVMKLRRLAKRLYAGDPEWIARVRDAGHEDLARQAAIESNVRVDGMQDLLMSFGYSSDPFYAWEIATVLAQHYRSAHPNAVRLGLVEHVQSAADVDLFLLFDIHSPDHPRIAVLWPTDDSNVFSTATAVRWLRVLLPRGTHPALKALFQGPGLAFPEGVDHHSRDLGNDIHLQFNRLPGMEEVESLAIVANGIYRRWQPKARFLRSVSAAAPG